MPAVAETLARILQQGVLLVTLVLLGAVAGASYALLKTPTYAAEAHVVVLPVPPRDDVTAVKFAQAYGRIATGPGVLSRTVSVIDGASQEGIRRQVRVATSPDAPLVQLTASAGTPKRAADLANDVARALLAFGNARSGETKVRLAVFAEASPPEGPSSPNPPLDVGVGAAAGLLIGGLAVMAGVGRGRPRGDRRDRRKDAAPAATDLARPGASLPTAGRPASPDGHPSATAVGAARGATAAEETRS
jgi:capsular polysaccharide biosynthesis protein